MVTQVNAIQPSVIGYLPVIIASTVYVLLKLSIALADLLNQHDIVVVFSQAIYTLARAVVFEHKAELPV